MRDSPPGRIWNFWALRWFEIMRERLAAGHDRARSLKPGERPIVDEKPQLGASEIEAELLVELQKLPTLHDTQSVTIRPFSGPQGWTWELDSIEPEVGPEQSKFADVTNVVARLQQQFDLDPSA
jgi:hypothetical protein